MLSSKYSGRAGARVARWQARLMPYSLTVEYVPGKHIPGADALSRFPSPAEQSEEMGEDEVIAVVETDEGAVTEGGLRDASASDTTVMKLRENLLNGFPRSPSQCTAEVRPFYPFQHELSNMDGMVVRGSQVIVPTSLGVRYLELAHGAHDGVVRTKQLLRSVAWWPRMDKAVENMVRECNRCQTSDRVLSQRTRLAPLQQVPLPSQPWYKLGWGHTFPYIAPDSSRQA
ncbi:hypothetical protein GWK47_002879 [Chionoecetes opilio]|uniref:RNA-directed DNA polymerase n=1 Tax=Chionoecetes opilio TaxID=41210 RepID=A0A8J5CIW7_CHIOP|nr:hypothetical protein GWK47_002879 [Chionoecetes opilio]